MIYSRKWLLNIKKDPRRWEAVPKQISRELKAFFILKECIRSSSKAIPLNQSHQLPNKKLSLKITPNQQFQGKSRNNQAKTGNRRSLRRSTSAIFLDRFSRAFNEENQLINIFIFFEFLKKIASKEEARR